MTQLCLGESCCIQNIRQKSLREVITIIFISIFILFINFLQGKLTAQGKLLHRGPLLCLDNFPAHVQSSSGSSSASSSAAQSASGSSGNGPAPSMKMKPFTVFLFEQIMIFSETVGKKTQFTSPGYQYKSHFLVS